MRKLLAFAGLAPVAAFAEGSATITLPTEFSTAVSELQSVGTQAASSLAPMILAVAGAFVVLGLITVAVRYFRRNAK